MSKTEKGFLHPHDWAEDTIMVMASFVRAGGGEENTLPKECIPFAEEATNNSETTSFTDELVHHGKGIYNVGIHEFPWQVGHV